MVRTAEAYRQELRDGRKAWMDNDRVADVTNHPAFKPITDVKARTYDMANESAYHSALTYIAPAPHFNHLAAVYNSFDFYGSLDFVRKAASLSETATIPPS